MNFPAIDELLPHRPPMIWLDEVLDRGPEWVRCALTVRDEHVFVQDGRAEAVVSVEWMAQTIGTLVGLYDRDKDRDPRPGFLIAIPEATFEVESFAVGERVEVTCERVWGDDNLASFHCAVEREGQVVARAQISVYRTEVGEELP